jgi:hypothetical protein
VYRSRTTKPDDGRLFRLGESGRKGDEFVVSVYVGIDDVDWTVTEDPQILDPLARMSPEAIRKLRGIHLGGWTKGTENRLAHLDEKRACVSVGGAAEYCDTVASPPLPLGLHYLLVDDSSGNGIKEFLRLGEQKELRLLDFTTQRSEPIELELLQDKSAFAISTLADNASRTSARSLG